MIGPVQILCPSVALGPIAMSVHTHRGVYTPKLHLHDAAL